MKSWTNSLALLISVLALSAATLGAASLAQAQVDPESGDTGQWQPPPPAQPQPPPPVQQPQPQPQPQPQAQPNAWQQQAQQPAWMNNTEERPPAMGGQQPGAARPASGDDHTQMIGRMAVSFFGVQRVQVGVTATDRTATLSAPTIGIRRWINDSIGIDVGLGIGFGSFSASKETGGATLALGGVDSVFSLGLHVGLPVALAHSGHFTALLIPEVDFGYASAKMIVAPTVPDQDLTLTGIDFRLGARIGGEIHFGFWGLPQLSLQGTVGLGIRYRSSDANDSIDFAAGGVSETESSFSIDSFVNDIANGTIRINYYF